MVDAASATVVFLDAKYPWPMSSTFRVNTTFRERIPIFPISKMTEMAGNSSREQLFRPLMSTEKCSSSTNHRRRRLSTLLMSVPSLRTFKWSVHMACHDFTTVLEQKLPGVAETQGKKSQYGAQALLSWPMTCRPGLLLLAHVSILSQRVSALDSLPYDNVARCPAINEDEDQLASSTLLAVQVSLGPMQRRHARDLATIFFSPCPSQNALDMLWPGVHLPSRPDAPHHQGSQVLGTPTRQLGILAR